ncbi:hypothetical protein GCM10010967_07190 [Dyadobacter beijingensis]|uniref:DUF4375 domain-containing protein n=1 Tax=Dyadobacter beijingensis TaxID=365489 RepID=A0ABQ2HFH0_9BACT|nr:hypothetical protein [Dyadobacter beijingensis]GGM78045.1 hypothetical protein GCM10010967_07190 [Dyadobacter beijingensis]
MNTTHITLLLSIAVSACSVEKQGGTVPDKEAKVLEYLQNGFNEGNLTTIPFDLNFHNLKPAPDYDIVFYQTMFQDRLFLPADDKLTEIEAGKPVVPDWQTEAGKVDRFLKKMEAGPYLSLYKQECARGMITKTNLLADTSSLAANELGKYVDILIQEKAYAPGLVAYGLSRLQKFWPGQKIADAVHSTLHYRSEVVENYDHKIALLEKGAASDANTEILVEFREIRRQNELYFSRLSGMLN